MSKPLVALCVGHSRKVTRNGHSRIEGGAVSIGGESEWSYNRRLAEMIEDELSRYQIDTVTISEYDGNGYNASQRWLAGRLRSFGATIALELHFNAASPAANGHEFLHHPRSSKGKMLARDLSNDLCLGVPELRSRGIKQRFSGSGSENRGWQFLYYPPMPSVIVENFFGSNASDWEVATSKMCKIARANAEGIASFLD